MNYVFEMSQAATGADRATCQGYEATSRNGVSCKLARALVEEGFEDGSVDLVRDSKVVMRINTLHGWATRSYTDGERRIGQTKFCAMDDKAKSAFRGDE